MRLIPLLTAAVVMGFLYLLVFERPALIAFADGDVQIEPAAVEEETPTERRVSIVARLSVAQTVDSAVLVRGRTEAARQVDVRAETSGLVISDPLRRGAFVEAGTLLCELDPGTRDASLAEAMARLPEAQAQLREAQARLSEAQINDRAAQQLSQGGFASQTRVAATEAAVEAALAGVESAEASVRSAEASIRAAETEIERLQITAPFAGLLETDSAELGSLLQPGGACATILQLDPIKLVGFVPETEVARVAVGAAAAARLATGQEVAGEVTFISRAADEMTRTFRVEVEVPNPDLTIRDGQTAEIMVSSDGTDAHLLPGSALTLNDEGALGVRIVDTEDRAAFVPVQFIRDTIDGVWIAGLPAEARVIVIGQEFVTDGVPVAVTLQEATP